MSEGLGAKAGLAVAVLSLSALTACGGAPGEGGMGFSDMLLTAGTTLPPAQTVAAEDVYCPPVNIVEGGSAIQAYSGGRTGDATALRSQISIGQLARECVGQADGSTLVKVGVEARALLGAGGSAGRYEAPIQIVMKNNGSVLANRSRRMAIAIPAGGTQGSVTVIEEGIVVPAAYANTFEIDVGLGGRAPSGSGRRRG